MMKTLRLFVLDLLKLNYLEIVIFKKYFLRENKNLVKKRILIINPLKKTFNFFKILYLIK